MKLDTFNLLKVQVITPEKKVYDGEVNAVTLPGSKGAFQVLIHHADLISTLTEGNILLKTSAGDKTIRVSGGVAEIYKDKVIVLVESVLA